MSFYHKPSAATRALNRFLSWLASFGLTPRDTVTLEIRGRRSGKVRTTAVTWVEHEGERYLVSPRGESEWVRNVRAAAGEGVIRRRGRQRVRLEEVPTGERAPIIQAYLQKTFRATREHFGVDPAAELEEFAAIAGRHPVFRIVAAG